MNLDASPSSVPTPLSALPETPGASPAPDFAASAQRLQKAIARASRNLVDRAALVESVALCAVAGEHLLVIGPPGTAKSGAVRRVATSLGGSYFEYLLGRFTEPSEIFGPVDLRRLREGVVETETAGMLPEAQIAFLDEVFQGSTAILNTLLGILNERVFRRGHTAIRCPLRVCVGASNALPDDPNLAAFADRFLARVWVQSVPDPSLEELLEGGWNFGDGESQAEALASMADIDTLQNAARAADMSHVRAPLAEAIRLLRRAGIELSDRRAVKSQKLVAAAAILDGRTAPDERDLWPLVWCVPTPESQALARETLRERLDRSRNASLPHSSESASQGPLARALRLQSAAQEMFETPETARDGAWKLRLEGIAREIDAAFAPEHLPETLKETRAQIVGALES